MVSIYIDKTNDKDNLSLHIDGKPEDIKKLGLKIKDN